MKTSVRFASLSLSLGLAATSFGQGEILKLGDDVGHAHFGAAVAGVGDIDQDGFDDVAVGAPLGSFAQVRSGQTGAVLHHWSGGTLFGSSMAGPGDLDLDGVPDVVVGESGLSGSGFVHAFSGQSGLPLWSATGGASFSGIGAVAAVAGDVDSDGVCDVVVAGKTGVVMLSGRTGAAVYSFTTPQAPGALAGGADVDQDGIPDFAVGIPTANNGRGRVELRSGPTGAVLKNAVGGAVGDNAGTAVVFLSDVDSDGVPDFAVGEPGVASVGRVRVLSGKDVTLLYASSGTVANGELGYTIARVPDVDSDGFDEVLIGARKDVVSPGGFTVASARLLSGATGSFLLKVVGVSTTWFGSALAAAGDVNGDGHSDFIVGAYHGDVDGAPDTPGTAQVFTAVCGSSLSFGTGCPGSGGITPKLAFEGCAAPGVTATMKMTKGLGGASAILFVGSNTLPQPLPSGCEFLIDPNGMLLFPVVLGGVGAGDGSLILEGELPPSFPLVLLFAQAAILDPGASTLGFSLTGGLRVKVQ